MMNAKTDALAIAALGPSIIASFIRIAATIIIVLRFKQIENPKIPLRVVILSHAKFLGDLFFSQPLIPFLRWCTVHELLQQCECCRCEYFSDRWPENWRVPVLNNQTKVLLMENRHCLQVIRYWQIWACWDIPSSTFCIVVLFDSVKLWLLVQNGSFQISLQTK